MRADVSENDFDGLVESLAAVEDDVRKLFRWIHELVGHGLDGLGVARENGISCVSTLVDVAGLPPGKADIVCSFDKNLCAEDLSNGFPVQRKKTLNDQVGV